MSVVMVLSSILTRSNSETTSVATISS
jgi:hypothetical protein